MKVTGLKCTCWPCPSQWEARTEDGRFVYIRYRWGELHVGSGSTLEGAVEDAAQSPAVYESENVWDGDMGTEEMLERTGFREG